MHIIDHNNNTSILIITTHHNRRYVRYRTRTVHHEEGNQFYEKGSVVTTYALDQTIE